MSIKHTIRKDEKGNTKSVMLTRGTAIRAFCHECMGFNFNEVEKCTAPLCPLYPFRNRKTTKGTGRTHQKTSVRAPMRP